MLRLLLIIFFGILLVACKEDDENNDPAPAPGIELPPATQEGANTFGCYVNGKPYRQRDELDSWQDEYVSANVIDHISVRTGGFDTTYLLDVLCKGGRSALHDTLGHYVANLRVLIPYPPEVGKRYRAITDPLTEWGGAE